LISPDGLLLTALSLLLFVDVGWWQRYVKYVQDLVFDNPDLVDDKLRKRLEVRASYGLSLRFSQTITEFMEELRAVYYWAVKKTILDYRYEVADEEERSHFLGLQIFPGKEKQVPPPL
jgi:hypothetical protein